MKQFLKIKYLPLAVLGCGIITYLLRMLLWISAIGNDNSSLLPTGSWPDAMSWIFTGLTLGFLFWSTGKLHGHNKYSENFSASLPGALGMALAAVCFCITSSADLSAGTDTLGAVSAFLGYLAAVSLLILAYVRFKGMHLSIIFHSIICFYLMLHLVSHFRLWSSAPQLQSYAFELLAIVFVMLACYQRAAFDAGSGNRKTYSFFSLAALFFCIAALPGCDNAAFFIGCAAWMYFTPCKLSLPAQKEE